MSLTFIMFLFYLNQTYGKTWINFIHFWSSCLERTGVPCYMFICCTLLTFQIWLTFPLKDHSKLKDPWLNRDLIKLNNEIIDIINYHINYFIVCNIRIILFNNDHFFERSYMVSGIPMQFSKRSIWPTDRSLGGIITPGQSEPGSTQHCSLTARCSLMLYLRYPFGYGIPHTVGVFWSPTTGRFNLEYI